MAKVYVVTVGDSVLGVFSTAKIARDFADQDDGEIEACEIDAGVDRKLRPLFYLTMSMDTGNVISSSVSMDMVSPSEEIEKCSICDSYDPQVGIERCKVVFVASYVSAEHALKLATEARQAHLQEVAVTA